MNFNVQVRITPFGNNYIDFLINKYKCKYKINKYNIINIIVKKYKHILLLSTFDVPKKKNLVIVPVHTLEEQFFYTLQVRKNIAYMLDIVARNDKEFMSTLDKVNK